MWDVTHCSLLMKLDEEAKEILFYVALILPNEDVTFLKNRNVIFVINSKCSKLKHSPLQTIIRGSSHIIANKLNDGNVIPTVCKKSSRKQAAVSFFTPQMMRTYLFFPLPFSPFNSIRATVFESFSLGRCTGEVRKGPKLFSSWSWKDQSSSQSLFRIDRFVRNGGQKCPYR